MLVVVRGRYFQSSWSSKLSDWSCRLDMVNFASFATIFFCMRCAVDVCRWMNGVHLSVLADYLLIYQVLFGCSCKWFVFAFTTHCLVGFHQSMAQPGSLIWIVWMCVSYTFTTSGDVVYIKIVWSSSNSVWLGLVCRVFSFAVLVVIQCVYVICYILLKVQVVWFQYSLMANEFL